MELRLKTFSFIKNFKACHIYFFTALREPALCPIGEGDEEALEEA